MSIPFPGDGTKSDWPELVGKPVTPAAHVIAYERPDLTVEVFPPGSPPVYPDYDPKRVCVYFDDNGLVSQVPVVG